MARRKSLLLVPAALILLTAILPSCGKGTTKPASKSSPTATATPVNHDPTIQAMLMQADIDQNIVSGCEVYVMDGYGNAVANAPVTVVSNGASVPLTFVDVESSNPPPNLGLSSIRDSTTSTS